MAIIIKGPSPEEMAVRSPVIKAILVIAPTYQQGETIATKRSLPDWFWFPNTEYAAAWIDRCKAFGQDIDPTYVFAGRAVPA